MLCPDDITLHGLIDDTLPENSQADVTGHLTNCADCRERLENLARGDVLNAAGDEGNPSAPPAVVAPLVSASEPTGNFSAHPTRQGHESATWTFLKNQVDPPRSEGSIGALGSFDLLELVGEGGMGVVVKARDTKLNRTVAIKIISPMLAASSEARQRFLREARAAAAVDHENVVTIHSVEESNGLAWLVMRYVDGQSLSELIRETGPLPSQRVLNLAEQIAKGLAAAHERGLVHRDIKPANILVEPPADRVRITDFGLAKSNEDNGLTSTGSVAGTPQYMSPEQAAGETVDHRSDLFSFGSVLYFLTTGRAPWSGTSSLSIIRQVCDKAPVPVTRVIPEVAQPLRTIIERLMSRAPDDRFQTAEDVASAIHAGVTLSGNNVTLPRGRQRLVWGLSGLLLSTVVAVLGSRALQSESANSNRGAANFTEPVPPVMESDPESQLIETDLDRSGFVIVGADDCYDSLSQAIAAATNGDTIEVHGDGPFEVEPIVIERKALTIRAAADSVPLFDMHGQLDQSGFYGVETDSDLTLERLTMVSEHEHPKRVREILRVHNANLRLTNCIMRGGHHTSCVAMLGGVCDVSDCMIGKRAISSVAFKLRGGAALKTDNCVIVASIGLYIECVKSNLPAPEVVFANTTSCNGTFLWAYHNRALLSQPGAALSARLLLDNCVVGVRTGMTVVVDRQHPFMTLEESRLAPKLAELFEWRGDGVVHSREIRNYCEVLLHQECRKLAYPGTITEWVTFAGHDAAGIFSANVEQDPDFAAEDPQRYKLSVTDITNSNGNGVSDADLNYGADTSTIGPGKQQVE